jgi:hypothetical protein
MAGVPTKENSQNNASQVSSARLSFTGRVKELFRKYGKVALGVHIGVYTTFLAGCYIAVDQKLDLRGVLVNVGLIHQPGEGEEPGWLDKALSGGGSTLAMAVLLNKAMFPIRTPITLGLTPYVARLLNRYMSKKRSI